MNALRESHAVLCAWKPPSTGPSLCNAVAATIALLAETSSGDKAGEGSYLGQRAMYRVLASC